MGAWIAWPFALFAGALITAQAGANAALKRSFDEPMPALVVTGQLVASVVVDHYGCIGFETHPAGWERMLGCVLMIVGFTLIAKF